MSENMGFKGWKAIYENYIEDSRAHGRGEACGGAARRGGRACLSSILIKM